MTKRKIDKLQRLLKSRTNKDGTPKKGYEQNVATIQAHIAQINEVREGLSSGE
jgi:hypothetical protein